MREKMHMRVVALAALLTLCGGWVAGQDPGAIGAPVNNFPKLPACPKGKICSTVMQGPDLEHTITVTKSYEVEGCQAGYSRFKAVEEKETVSDAGFGTWANRPGNYIFQKVVTNPLGGTRLVFNEPEPVIYVCLSDAFVANARAKAKKAAK